MVVPQVASAFPRAQGYVNDFAGILNRQVSADLASELRSTELRTTAEIVVVTVPSTEGMTIENYANGLFNEWGIGKRGKDNGVLVLVAPVERHVRIEVGYGLEPVLSDGLAGEIIRTNFLPAFRRGDFGNGILAGVRRIIDVVNQDHALTAEERSQLTSDQTVQPPWLSITLFVGVFVAVAAFLFGFMLGMREIFSLLIVAVFTAVGVLMLIFAIPLPALAVSLVPFLVLGMAVWGFVVGRWQPRKLALQTSSGFGNDSTPWTPDSSSGSSGGDFGGGSSGGGGATGSW